MYILICLVSILIGCLLISFEWNVTKYVKYHVLMLLLALFVILVFEGTGLEKYWSSESTGYFIILPLLISFFSGYTYAVLIGKVTLPKE